MNRISQFGTSLQIGYISTEVVWNFWASYRQWSRYHFTLCQVNTDKHAVHWLTKLFWFRNVPMSNKTLEVNHSEFHCVIIRYQFLFRHYHRLPNTSNLLQATECTLFWRIQYIKNKYIYPLHCELHVTV